MSEHDGRPTGFVEFDPAFAIKFTIARLRPSRGPGDSGIFGARQYAPLPGVEVTLPDNELLERRG